MPSWSEVETQVPELAASTELVVIGLTEARDKLVIESWHSGSGVSRIER